MHRNNKVLIAMCLSLMLVFSVGLATAEMKDYCIVPPYVKTDIKPKGFRVIEFDDYITEETVELTRRILADKELEIQMCEHNYQLALRYFSFSVLRNKLKILLDNAFGTNSY